MYARQNFFRSLLLTSTMLASGAAGAFAQTPTGTIAGTVLDSTGASVANATVTVTNTATNVSQTLKTDAGGRYSQAFLNPGQYQVKVVATGFTPTQQNDVTVDVAQTHSVDFSLAVGSDTANVTVAATTPSLQTDDSTTGQVITGKRILELPLNGRNPFALAELVPGVNNTSGPYGASTPSFAGSRNSNNEQQLDGITNILPENNVGNNSSAYTPVVDSVDEFNVQTSVETAEYGRFSGGLINLATRTGTNKFHGDLFEFNRDSILDATDYFATVKPALLRNQAGGTFGGPIYRDKTFFFVGAQISRTTSSQTEVDSVATAAERTGDFSALLAQATPVQLYDPTKVTAVTTNGQTVYNRTPYPNNQIPAGEFSNAGAKILAFQPLPNVNTASLNNNYLATGTMTDNNYQFDVRVDQNWSQTWKSFVRYSQYHDTNVPFADFPQNNGAASLGYGGPATATSHSFAYDNTFTLSPTLVLDLRYGFSRSTEDRTPFGGEFDITQLGLPGSLASIADYGEFPYISIGNGYSSIGPSGYVALLENPSVHDVLGSFTKIIGGHSLKYGGEYRKLFLNFHQYGVPTGQFSFSQSWTQAQVNNSAAGGGNPFADLLLGLPDSGYQSNDPTFATSGNYYALYAQDTWKATPHVTLSYGLRWDADQPRTERHNQLSYWNPADPSPIQSGPVAAGVLCPNCTNLTGSMHFVGTAGGQFGRQQVNTHKLDFGPRFGAIWSPSEQWAIRGGFGIVFAPSAVQPAGTSGGAGTEGYSTDTNANFSFDSERTIATTLDNPFPNNSYNLPAGAAGGAGTDLGNTIMSSFLTNGNSRTPYSEQADLTIQRSLPGQTVVELGWLYNQGQFLISGDPGIPFDQVNPSYLSLGSTLQDLVPNPFYGIITTPGSALAQPTIQRSQLLKPFPQYANVIEYRKSGAHSNYNAITARLDKRFAQGLTLLVSYTGAKLLDNSPAAVTYLGPYSSTYENQYNPEGEYSVSPQDIGHQLVSSYTYELPFGPGRRYLSNIHGIASGFVSGWQSSGIVSYIGGNPVIVGGLSSDVSGLGLLGNGRPDVSTYNVKLSNPTRNQWFNTAAFSTPAQFTIGNAPRTLANVRTPRDVDADLSAIKNTYFGNDQHYNLQLRFEFFNAFNHAWLAPPDAGVNDGSNFGKITNTATGYNPRNIQLAAKFLF